MRLSARMCLVLCCLHLSACDGCDEPASGRDDGRADQGADMIAADQGADQGGEDQGQEMGSPDQGDDQGQDMSVDMSGDMSEDMSQDMTEDMSQDMQEDMSEDMGQDMAMPSGFAGVPSLGGLHTCALSGGAVYCWGSNQYGQVGDAATSGSLTPVGRPVQVAGLANVTQLAAAITHTCAVSAGEVSCWGRNDLGQLGHAAGVGTYNANPTPARVAGLPAGVTQLVTGSYHSCAIAAGALYCWGSNVDGGLGSEDGLGQATPQTAPRVVPGYESGAQAVAAGQGHTCALKAGEVKCWGANLYGQAGPSATVGMFTPSAAAVTVAGLPAGVTQLAAGLYHTCAVSGAGALHCWGNNANGQLGVAAGAGPGGMPQPAPQAVQGMGAQVERVVAGALHTCAARAGALSCWGANTFGQAGDPATFGQPVLAAPAPVVGLSGALTGLSAGDYHTCAEVGGALYCWGANDYAQLGVGGVTPLSTAAAQAVLAP